MDTWLRRVFLPALDDDVRVILSGREPPLPGWSTSAEWRGLFESLPLGPLEDDAALALLAEYGVAAEPARRINRMARGHPLALRLAGSAVRDRPEAALDDAATQGVVATLTGLHLSGSRTRHPGGARGRLRAAPDHPAAARGDARGRTGARRVRAPPTLPFVELARDGLVVHEAVQQVIAAGVRSADPARHRAYRRAAWSRLRSEMSAAGTAELWRYTADMLYLIENPVVREAFFPTGAQSFSVEPATPADEAGIEAIAAREEPAGGAELLRRWWDDAPGAFSVVRDREGDVVGFFTMFDPAAMRHVSLLADPVTRVWLRHLHDHPVGRDEAVLFLRRWLGTPGGEGPSPIQAACWLDIKRTYMALRPRLRRVYTGVRDLRPTPRWSRSCASRRSPAARWRSAAPPSTRRCSTSATRPSTDGSPSSSATSWASTTPSPSTRTPASWSSRDATSR